MKLVHESNMNSEMNNSLATFLTGADVNVTNDTIQRHTAVAVVTLDVMESYASMNLEGGIFSINCFHFYGIGCDDYPRYQKYSIHRDDFELWISKKTILTPLKTTEIGFQFAFYPYFPSMIILADDKTFRKMLIDVVGNIVQAKFMRSLWNEHQPAFIRLTLSDSSGEEMTMLLYDPCSKLFPIPLSRAVKNKSTIFASRIKLMHTRGNNILVCTDLTKIVFEPLVYRNAEI